MEFYQSELLAVRLMAIDYVATRLSLGGRRSVLCAQLHSAHILIDDERTALMSLIILATAAL
jgi:hypothetical protein